MIVLEFIWTLFLAVAGFISGMIALAFIVWIIEEDLKPRG
jgi:hypothetical protein